MNNAQPPIFGDSYMLVAATGESFIQYNFYLIIKNIYIGCE
jgi:hypothetical protein